MDASLTRTLQKLSERIREAKRANEALRQRNAELEAANARLALKVQEALEGKRRAELDAEYLAVSHKLADAPDTLAYTRKRIAGLIRNIDRCLEMLRQ